MPLKRHRKYLVHFELADGEHIAVADAISVESEGDAKLLTSHVMQAIGVPTGTAAVEGADAAAAPPPEVKLLDIVPLESAEQLEKAVADLRARDPERPLADDLVRDGVIATANQLLTNVEIPRGLAQLATRGR